MRIHPYADADAVGLAGLWDGEVPSLGSGLHGADRAAPRWKRTLVAQEGDRLVGVATVGQNWAHPGWYSAAVDVAPGHRRQGIGRALLAALRGLPPAPKPLLGKIWADDPASTGFLAAAGGTVVQRCPPMTVPLRHPDVREWAATRTLPDATTVRTGAELTTAQLTRLWTDVYCWVHQPWAPTDTRSAMDSGFATITDSMDLPATRIAFRAGQPAAAAFVIPAPGTTYVVAETISPDPPDGRHLVAGLLAITLNALPGDQASLDGHITDPHLWPAAATIPHRTGRELLLVQTPP